MDELRESERRLLRAIARVCREHGSVMSLFSVAVVLEGMNYSSAHRHLTYLESKQLVRVERRGPGYPLVMRALTEEI